MSEGKSSVISRNVTHFQSLQVLHYIVNFQYDNFHQQVSDLQLDTTQLTKIYRSLDDLLIYMNDGIFSIERFYSYHFLHDFTKQRDLQYEFENLELLGQDIRILKRKCNQRKVSLEHDKLRLRQYGPVKSLFLGLIQRNVNFVSKMKGKKQPSCKKLGG